MLVQHTIPDFIRYNCGLLVACVKRLTTSLRVIVLFGTKNDQKTSFCVLQALFFSVNVAGLQYKSRLSGGGLEIRGVLMRVPIAYKCGPISCLWQEKFNF